jgi:hypothetical protein
MQFDLFEVGRVHHEPTERDGRSRLAKAGEYLVAFEFVIRGLDVTIAAEGLPYDLLVDADGHIIRVQVKTSSSPADDGRYSFNTMRCSHKGAKKSRRYTEKDVDLFAFVAADVRQIVFYPADQVVGQSVVRFRPADLMRYDVASTTLSRSLEALAERRAG